MTTFDKPGFVLYYLKYLKIAILRPTHDYS